MVISETDLFELALQGEAHTRLAWTNGLPTWEASPSYAHNDLALAIYDSIRPTGQGADGCGCFRAFDSYIRFDERTIRRPDIAIFCTQPPRTRSAITLIPAAVIEILSLGYEEKDRIAVPIYLQSGVRDVLLVDPETQTVDCWTSQGVTTHMLPYVGILTIGCSVTIPRLEILDEPTPIR